MTSTEAVIELEVCSSLMDKGISRIAKEGPTLCLELNKKSLRATIYKNDVTRTINNLSKLVKDEDTKEEIKSYISDNWSKLFPEDAPSEEGDYEDGEAKSQVESIIELAAINCKFFMDQFGAEYALLNVKDHYESMPINSHSFKMHLVMSYREHVSSKPPSSDSINSAILSLQSEAHCNGETIPLHIRVAWSEDKKSIYYDLTDESWRCMKISKDKVDILLGLDVNFPLFKRYSQTPQPVPQPGFNPEVFDKFMSLTNVKNKDDILLTKVLIVSMIIPDIQRIVPSVNGGQGAAKTALEMTIKWLVDPDRPKNLLSVPQDKIEFQQQLSHRHIAFYDNLKTKKYTPWLAEEVCKASTGGGTTKRELFSNEGDIIFDYKMTVGFNGINMILNEPDVLRRSIILELETIEDEDKIEPEELDRMLEEIKPDVLGYIFDTVSKAMSIKDSIKLKSKPGLSDFAVWGEAISRAMGYQEMEFIDAYRRNITKQHEEVIESDSFAKTISLLSSELFSPEISDIKARFKLIEGTWCITATGFLRELDNIGEREGIDTVSDWFPKATNKISYRLRIVRTNLKSQGIDVVIRKSTTNQDINAGFNKNTIIVGIRNLGKDSKDSKDTVTQLNGNDNNIICIAETKEIERIESSEVILTTPTIATCYNLMLVYKGSQFLNHLQHDLRTCPICEHTDTAFYMRMHQCMV